jgi:hypothetical protein
VKRLLSGALTTYIYGFRERAADERIKAKGKDVERNGYQSFGAANVELLHELKSCWADDRSSDGTDFVNKTG